MYSIYISSTFAIFVTIMCAKEKNKAKSSVHVENRRARFEYELLEKYEAGIILQGTEIKSIRLNNVVISDSFCYVQDNEVFVKGMHIGPLQDAADNHEPDRVRKLLLKKTEIKRIANKLIKGTTLVVTRLYLTNRGLCKLEIAVGKGKKLYDKRETIKKRDNLRDTQREAK